MHYLYVQDSVSTIPNFEPSEFLLGCMLRKFRPRLFHLAAPYEKINLKTRLSRLQFWLTTKGKCWIYHLCDGENVVHTAYVVPPCRKFPFLKHNDYEIGPCSTEAAYRKRGAYRFVLSKILEKESDRGAAYMIVSDTNAASIKGIESVGFVRVGIVKQDGIFKNYRLEN